MLLKESLKHLQDSTPQLLFKPHDHCDHEIQIIAVLLVVISEDTTEEQIP